MVFGLPDIPREILKVVPDDAAWIEPLRGEEFDGFFRYVEQLPADLPDIPSIPDLTDLQ
jgi:hypothetical protein